MNPYGHQGGHHHHHHHGHHGHHHHEKPIVVVVDNQGFSNQGFNNQGFSSSQGFNNSQGFNTGIGLINQIVNNQGWSNNGLFNPNQEYIIESGVGHDMVLDVSQSKENHGQLIIWKRHGKKNQRFRIVNQGGRYCIVSCSSMNVVSVQNNSHNDGEAIFTHYNNGHHGQLWEFQHAKDHQNSFYIRNGNGKYLDVFERRHSGGTPIIQWKYNGKKNQVWRIVPA